MCVGTFTLSFLILSFIYCRERGLLTHKLSCSAPCKLYSGDPQGRSPRVINDLPDNSSGADNECCVAVLLEVTVQFSSSVNSKNGARINRT
jgi:hypothetical protein